LLQLARPQRRLGYRAYSLSQKQLPSSELRESQTLFLWAMRQVNDRHTVAAEWLLPHPVWIYGAVTMRLGRSRQYVAPETASPKCLFSRRRTEIFQAMHVSDAVSAGMRQLNDDRSWLLSGCCHTHIDPGAVTIAVSRLRHVPLSKCKSFPSAFRFAHSRAAICRVC
jgi:hypothetical protein